MYWTRIVCKFVLLTLLTLPVAGFSPSAALADDEEKTKFHLAGDLDISFNYADGVAFNNNRNMDAFSVPQRLRLFASAIVSNEFSLHALVRIKPDRWGEDGTPNSGYNLDGDGNIFLTRFIFAKWKPYDKTNVHMGIIPLALPFAGYRNGVLDTSVGGISADYSFTPDMKATLAWGRAYDNVDRATGKTDDDADLFVLMASLNFPEYNFKFSPWAVYANIGDDSKYWQDRVPHITHSPVIPGVNPWDAPRRKTVHNSGDGIWAGFASAFTNGPFSLKADFAYGQITTDKCSQAEALNYNTSGWHASLKADYKLSWGVPALFGWYASGSDYDDVVNDQKWGHLPSISTFGDGFAPTSLGFPGGGQGMINTGGLISFVPSGKWGAGAEIDEISFIENVKHTIRVAYYAGTNDNELAANNPMGNLANTKRDFILMVKDDHIVEVNFDHVWQFSPKVKIALFMGYMDIHRSGKWGNQRNLDDVYAASLSFKYQF